MSSAMGAFGSLVGKDSVQMRTWIVDCRGVKDEMTASGLSAKAHGF